MSHIQDITKAQIAIDRCTGQFALRLKHLSNRMEASHQRVNLSRAAFKTACTVGLIAPTICKSVTDIALTHLKVERGIQSIIRAAWDLQSREWNWAMPLVCEVPLLASKGSFPEFPYRIVDADITELMRIQPEIRSHPAPVRMQIKLGQLLSEAGIDMKPGEKHEWTSAWTQ
jgi:hypothetical protein